MSIVTTASTTAQITASMRQKIDFSKDELRRDALDALEKLGLPAQKHEEYKYTPIARYLEKNFTFAPSDAAGKLSSIEPYMIGGLDAHVMVFIDGVWSKDHSSPIGTTGLTVVPLEDALARGEAAAKQHFARYAGYAADALVAWNTAGWQHGLFIKVDDNIAVDKPVIIYNISNATAGEIVSLTRNLIVLGNDSNATVIEKFDSTGKANHFSNVVTEVVVGERARLNLYSLQGDPGNHFHFGLTQIQQAPSSFVNTFTFTLNGKLLRNNLNLALDGERIESHMYGLYLLDKDTHADNHTVVDHKQANSFSNELYKGVMDDQARGVFNGKIFVRPHAQKTNAFQSNRNILLSDRATINTKPQLEIWADDVKCSHGCTTGQIDEEALFYIRTRGISKETARAIMLYAFAGEILDQVKHPVLHRYLDACVSERLHKNF